MICWKMSSAQKKWFLALIIAFWVIVAGAACISNQKQSSRAKLGERQFNIYQECVETCIIFSEDKYDLLECVERCNTFNRHENYKHIRPYITKPKNKKPKELMKGK